MGTRPARGGLGSQACEAARLRRLTLRITRRYLQIMRSAAPALLPVFRSRLQADILAALLLKPGEEHSLTELADRFGAPLSTVHGEVKRLTDAGLLQRRQA